MNNDYFAEYYLARTITASKDQGIDDLIKALEKQGVKATSEQTGGFTMCAYIELKDDKYIYANPLGACVYDEEGFEKDIYNNDSKGNQKAKVKDVAKGVAKWIKNNQ